MADRYDVLTARESNGRTYWTKLGAMFPNRNGEGFTLMLDAMPAPQDGQFKLTAMVPKPREDRQDSGRQGSGGANLPQQSGYGATGNSGWDADSDSVPF